MNNGKELKPAIRFSKIVSFKPDKRLLFSRHK